MYIKTVNGKRYRRVVSSIYEKQHCFPDWPDHDITEVFDIKKSRPDCSDKPSGCITKFYMSEKINYLVITKSDLINLLDKAKTGYYRPNVLYYDTEDLVVEYNKNNNTYFKYFPHGKEYAQAVNGLQFDKKQGESNHDKISSLPEDYMVKIEVFKCEDFVELTELTEKEIIKQKERNKKEKKREIFDSFLKKSIDNIFREFGMSYNDYHKAFRFMSVKDFRMFLQKAIYTMMNEKLKENGIQMKQEDIGTSIRSDIIRLDCLNIIDVDSLMSSFNEEEEKDETESN